MSTPFLIAFIVLWVLVLTQGALILLVYRHFGLLSMETAAGVERDGLGLGEIAPPITGVTRDGEELTWGPSAGHSALVLFASPDCAPCAEVVPHIGALANSAAGLEVMTVVAGPSEQARAMADRFGPGLPCLAEDTGGVFDAYRVRVSPFAFVIGADGRVASKGLCSDTGRLSRLLDRGDLAVTDELFAKPEMMGSGSDLEVQR